MSAANTEPPSDEGGGRSPEGENGCDLPKAFLYSQHFLSLSRCGGSSLVRGSQEVARSKYILLNLTTYYCVENGLGRSATLGRCTMSFGGGLPPNHHCHCEPEGRGNLEELCVRGNGLPRRFAPRNDTET